MKIAPKYQKVKVKLNAQDFEIDSRIWSLFNAVASDKNEQCLLLASNLVSQGKSVERSLADALEKFKLV